LRCADNPALVCFPFCKSLERDCDGAVPELVERFGEPLDDRARGKDIVIAELGIGVDLKVLIADIASADECNRVVDHEQLVVHAVVEARSGECPAPRLRIGSPDVRRQSIQ
jgi:hypothetical protein